MSMSAGLAATDSTVVEIASGSLWRSTIMPRVAESEMTREYRDSPFACRKSLCNPWRYTARTISATNHASRPIRSSRERHGENFSASAGDALAFT